MKLGEVGLTLADRMNVDAQVSQLDAQMNPELEQPGFLDTAEGNWNGIKRLTEDQIAKIND